MNFCSGCGIKLSNNPKFCQQCGQSISGASNSTESNQSTQTTKPPLSDLYLLGKTKDQPSDQIIFWWVIRIALAAAFMAFIATRK